MNRNIFQDSNLSKQNNNQQYQIVNGRYVCLPSQQNTISTNPNVQFKQQPIETNNKLQQNTKNISQHHPPTETSVKKYNPDIEPNLKSLEHTRNNIKYTMTDSRYKTILNDVEIPKKIKNTKDLSLNIVEDKDDKKLKEKLEELTEERKYVDKKREELYNEENRDKNRKRFKYRNEEIYKLSKKEEDNVEEFDNLKQEVSDYYKKIQTDLEKDKETYNEIIESLVDAGILDD